MGKKFKEIVFYTRRTFDRRKDEDRRLFLKQEYLDHDSERRVNMIGRRMLGDRRKLLPEILNTFGEDAL
jgi:hypothetical protein